MSQKEIEIPKGWELKKISDIGDIQTGSTPNTTNSEYYGNDFPFYSPSDLDIFVEISISKKQLSKKGFEVSRKIPKDSILVQCIGDLGKCSIVKKEGACNQQINVIIPNKQKVLSKFVYYWIKSAYFNYLMKQSASRTTLPILNKSKFMHLPFFLPSLEHQKKIVQKLDHVLEKLEEKKKQILSLIEQNKGRIDFFEKNWISHVIDQEIEKHPQRKEWQLVKLKETFENSDQKWQPDATSELVNYIGLENIESNTGELVYFTPTESFKIKSSKTIFTEKMVLYGKLRPYLNKVLLPIFDGICSTDILPLLPKHNINKEFLAYFLRSWYVLSHVNKSVHGTKMPRTKIQVLQEIQIRLPNLAIQKQIIQNIKNAEEKFKEQKTQFEHIKENYDLKIKYINHIQLSILDTAFSGKLVH